MLLRSGLPLQIALLCLYCIDTVSTIGTEIAVVGGIQRRPIFHPRKPSQ